VILTPKLGPRLRGDDGSRYTRFASSSNPPYNRGLEQ